MERDESKKQKYELKVLVFMNEVTIFILTSGSSQLFYIEWNNVKSSLSLWLQRELPAVKTETIVCMTGSGIEKVRRIFTDSVYLDATSVMCSCLSAADDWIGNLKVMENA